MNQENTIFNIPSNFDKNDSKLISNSLPQNLNSTCFKKCTLILSPGLLELAYSCPPPCPLVPTALKSIVIDLFSSAPEIFKVRKYDASCTRIN